MNSPILVTSRGEPQHGRQLLRLLRRIAVERLKAMPPDERERALTDIASGRVVCALFVSECETRVKFNPPPEAIEAWFL